MAVDQIVEDVVKLKDAIEIGVAASQCEEKIVLLGAKPKYPSSGFGYIQIDSPSGTNGPTSTVYPVARFIEKPSPSIAMELFASQTCFWNAGVFIFTAATMQSTLRRFWPQLAGQMDTYFGDGEKNPKLYSKCESLSIDRGVFEKADNLLCVACDPGWTDVGCWDDIAAAVDNVSGVSVNSLANVESVASENCFVQTTQGKKVILLGVNDLIVVDSGDGLLILKKGESQKLAQTATVQQSQGVDE